MMTSSDIINKLRLKLSNLEPSCFEQIEEWRQAAFKSIDSFCDEKRYEFIEKPRIDQEKELANIQGDDIDRTLQLAEIKINELEHLRLTMRPLNLNRQLIVRRQLFPLSHSYRTLHLKTGLESAVGTNDQHLLVHRDDQHLCLLDRNLTLVREVSFSYDTIHGLCWSTTLDRFIIITFKEILLLDEKTMTLTTCPISSKIDWWRGTCSKKNLFLTTVEWGSSIYEFDLRSFQLVKQWYQPLSCSKDEIICDLKYNHGFLVMPIFNKHKQQSRLELRCESTLDCLWATRIHGRHCRCCSIDVNQWLVMDHDDSRFFHISADGKLLETNKYDYHYQQLEDIIPWGQDHIVILTEKTIHLHQLN